MRKVTRYTSLGLTASSNRLIKDGSEYNKYFSAPTGKVELLKSNGNTYDTLNFMRDYIAKYGNQTAKIAQVLKGSSLLDTCRNIEKWQMDHFKYRMDGMDAERYQAEEIHEPNKQWHKRHIGIDCDDFSIMASSILTQLRIPHSLRKADYGRGWQHVYVIVPLNKNFKANKRESYYCIDAVVDGLNNEKPFHKNYDVPMKIYGLGEAPTGIPNYLDKVLLATDLQPLTNSNLLGNSDEFDEEKMLASIYNNMVNTHNAILVNNPGVTDENQKLFNSEKERQAWLSMYDRAIKAFYTPKRDEVLKQLDAETRELFKNNVITSLSDEQGEPLLNSKLAVETADFKEKIKETTTRVLNGLGCPCQELGAEGDSIINTAALTQMQIQNMVKNDELNEEQKKLLPSFEADMKAYNSWYTQTWEVLYKIGKGIGYPITSRTDTMRDIFNSQRSDFRWKTAPTKLAAIYNKYKDSGLFSTEEYTLLKAQTIDVIDLQIKWYNAVQTVWNGLIDLIKAIAQKAIDVIVKVAEFVAKYNPLSAAARLAVLNAYKYNYRGHSSVFAMALGMHAIPPSQTLIDGFKSRYNKMRNIYVNLLRGDEDNLKKHIMEGSRKKPLFGAGSVYKKVFGDVDISELPPLQTATLNGGLGCEAACISALITAGAGVLASIVQALLSEKDISPEMQKYIEKSNAAFCDTNSPYYKPEFEAMCKVIRQKLAEQKNNTNTNTNIPDNTPPDTGDEGMSTGAKVGIVAFLLAAVGGGAYAYSQSKKKSKNLGCAEPATPVFTM